MPKKYIVRLTAAERATLTEGVKKLKGSSQKVHRVQILLPADADGPAWPTTAWSLVRRLECRHTPKHGSGLNIAENERSARTRQCVPGRRCATIAARRDETAAGHERTKDRQRGVDWQFRVDDARTKRKSLYPKIKG